MQRLCDVCRGVYSNKSSISAHQRKTGHKQIASTNGDRTEKVESNNDLGQLQDSLKVFRKNHWIVCNPCRFRRTLACILRKTGVGTMTTKDLGRWESLKMVQIYTRSVNLQDRTNSLKHC